MMPSWARSLRDQAKGAQIAFHFKQWGEWAPSDVSLAPDSDMVRVGKRRSGRALDDRTWDEVPA